MKSPAKHNEFTDDEKHECCLMVSMGCDRQTACHYLGKTAEQLRSEIRTDDDFRRKLLSAEATPEFSHMRNVYNAAKDEKHWRASVWWLERRAPDRYSRQMPDTVTATQLQTFVEELADTIVGEIADEQDRRRLLARLVEITESLQAAKFECSVDSPTTTVQNEPLQLNVNPDADSEAV